MSSSGRTRRSRRHGSLASAGPRGGRTEAASRRSSWIGRSRYSGFSSPRTRSGRMTLRR
jgi:hypothetical protein